jgi:hypothetical protein
MDRLKTCIESLRLLASQPASESNWIPLAEQRVDEYLRSGVAPRPSLERLGNAVSNASHPSEEPFWTIVREYVGSCLSKFPF